MHHKIHEKETLDPIALSQCSLQLTTVFKLHSCEKSHRTLITRKWCVTWVCFKCFFKYPSFEQALEQWLQGNGFTSECVVKCIFKFPSCEKVLVHYLQENGFSSVWVLERLSLLLMLVNFLDNKCQNETFFTSRSF